MSKVQFFFKKKQIFPTPDTLTSSWEVLVSGSLQIHLLIVGKKLIIYIANFTLCLFIFSCNKIEIPEPENGKRYSSEGENLLSSFEVISKEPFIENPDGLESSKLEVAIDCILYSIDGINSIHLENANATIAVSFPK